MAGIDRIMSASASSHEAARGRPADAVWRRDLGGGRRSVEPLARCDAQVSAKEALEWEKELVGVYVSSHPLQKMTVDLVNVVTHATAEITEELQ